MADVLMPQMGESVTEGTIVRWMKRAGDTVDKDEPLFEISTDKVDAEIPSPDAGVLATIHVKEGETVPVHTVVAVIAVEGEARAASVAAAPGAAAPAATSQPAAHSTQQAPAAAAGSTPASAGAAVRPVGARGAAPFLSPVVKKMAAAHGLDLSRVAGSGAGGRITRKDVDAYLAGGTSRPGSPAAAKTPLYQPGDDVRVEKMSVMRRKIADHMLTSLRTSAHIYSAYEVDFSRIAALRQKHKDAFQKQGANLTYTAFITQVVSATIKDHPYVNASVDESDVVYRNDINVGMAVALEHGLIVPVIRNADRKSLRDLCVEIADLAQRARTKQLKVEEVEAGTFTITNPGIFGGLWGLPIINQPQVAILAVGSIDKRAVVVDDQVVVRPMSYLTLGYDHRLIDGADGGRFLLALKQRLQEYDEAWL
jgi:2-oxoglutarate dehydrogenase E2 component (dihydrolipoamide succinyltransferase)